MRFLFLYLNAREFHIFLLQRFPQLCTVRHEYFYATCILPRLLERRDFRRWTPAWSSPVLADDRWCLFWISKKKWLNINNPENTNINFISHIQCRRWWYHSPPAAMTCIIYSFPKTTRYFNHLKHGARHLTIAMQKLRLQHSHCLSTSIKSFCKIKRADNITSVDIAVFPGIVSSLNLHCSYSLPHDKEVLSFS